jgi:hypothetical protein
MLNRKAHAEDNGHVLCQGVTATCVVWRTEKRRKKWSPYYILPLKFRGIRNWQIFHGLVVRPAALYVSVWRLTIRTVVFRDLPHSSQVNAGTKTNKTNSVALSPQANYTDWSTATCWRNLEPTFVDRGVSRGQRGGSPTVVKLSFIDRNAGTVLQNRIRQLRLTSLLTYNWQLFSPSLLCILWNWGCFNE